MIVHSSKRHVHVSKYKPNSLNLSVNKELISIYMSKSRVNRELLFALEMFINLIKLDDKLT